MNLFDIEKLKQEIENLEQETTKPNFWENTENSKTIFSKLKHLKSKYSNFYKIKEELKNLIELSNLLKTEFDEEIAKDIIKNTKNIEKEIEKLELNTLLTGKYDANNAIISIHPGAGGTESQDWAEMLYRMYTRWATKNNYEVKELDYLEGEEAGIKSVTFEVVGENAYGFLRGEKGIHRLVRISPFDSGGRRHTSFASVEVMPEITEDIEIEINPDDLRIHIEHLVQEGSI